MQNEINLEAQEPDMDSSEQNKKSQIEKDKEFLQQLPSDKKELVNLFGIRAQLQLQLIDLKTNTESERIKEEAEKQCAALLQLISEEITVHKRVSFIVLKDYDELLMTTARYMNNCLIRLAMHHSKSVKQIETDYIDNISGVLDEYRIGLKGPKDEQSRHSVSDELDSFSSVFALVFVVCLAMFIVFMPIFI